MAIISKKYQQYLEWKEREDERKWKEQEAKKKPKKK